MFSPAAGATDDVSRQLSQAQLAAQLDQEEAKIRYITHYRENPQSTHIRGQDASTERSAQQAQQSCAPPTQPGRRGSGEKSIEQMVELMILPPQKEDPALQGLPHIERSAFLRARAKQVASLLPAEGTAGTARGQRKIQSSALGGESKPSKSLLTAGSRSKMSTRKQKSCRQCGHEQTDNGTGTDISRKELEEKRAGRGSARSLQKGFHAPDFSSNQVHHTLPADYD